MRLLILVVSTVILVHEATAPPVTEKKKEAPAAEDNDINSPMLEVEYKKYLQEVVQLLEGDEDFKKKLMEATPEDIKSGNIAEHVDALHHGLRTKLDELKRQEVERLRHLAMQQYQLQNGIDSKHLKIAAHLDANNPHTFEAEDLRKLITHTTKELEAADVERKKEFKEYEMKKELTYQEQLKHMDEQNRIAAQKQHEEMLKKHNQHAPIHHPGSKHQYEQVWEEQDHLSPEDFNPKTFFHLHDLDENGFWDPVEVKALFKKELDKMYDPNAPEDDLQERYEEMERMREHVFNETDTNKDQLISYQEFLDQTKRKEFEEDGWDPIDPNAHPVYNEDEYKQYAQQHEEEIRKMIEAGVIPSAPPGYVPVVIPPEHQGQYQPGNHMPPPGAHPNSIPQGQYHPNAIPQGQGYHPNAVPQGQMNAPPPYHPNAGAPPLHQQAQFHDASNQNQQYHPQQQQQQQQHHAQQQQQQQQHHAQQQQQQFHQQNQPLSSSTVNHQAPPVAHAQKQEQHNQQPHQAPAHHQ